MGRDMGPILDEIRHLKEERDSWRRVSERLEREKQDLISRLQFAEKSLQKVFELDGYMFVKEALEQILEDEKK